ncbi:MAG: endonuclease MutS2 [Ruminococcaceae bacterium]|nr:endonuclease MutS2 [Oscillospiraceae bacterium]
MANFEKAIKTLEFDRVLEQLAAAAQTDGAKEKAMRVMPQTSLVRIRKLQMQTSDARKLMGIKGTPPFGGVTDITGHIDRAEKGASLSPAELLRVANVLRVARMLDDYINTDKRFETSLDEVFDRLTSNRYLEDRITKSILAEDLIADEASPELAEIRRKIRSANGKIKENLQKYTSGQTFSKYLQENIVTQRNGRYVVPVKAEYRNEVKGLIHDTSASGATLFIEPLSVVEANNELRFLENQEKKEIERILAVLSQAVADCASALSLDYHNITELAFIFAKAELSYRMNASEPQLNEDGIVDLKRARHPLLDPKKVVPIDIRLGGDFDTLVITGPNTGGKTVSLKTLGLFALMAQSGLHIPTSGESTVCIFDKIFADIGDEQSIEQSLSTFSAHMTNIVSILDDITPQSLVLFDELGAGTDPVEGAALAVSVLEHVRAVGARCAATTHYAELKAFALDTPGVCNASCEFDVATLRPTYRLVIGTPGKSNAFAISEKLGLPKDIIDRANALVSTENKRFETVIEQLEVNRMEMEKNADETARLRREYEEQRARADAEIAHMRETAEKELEKARAQAANIISSAKASSEYIFEQIEELKRKKDSENLARELDEARRAIRVNLKESDAFIDPIIKRDTEGYKLPRPLKVGDQVILVNLDMQGTVTATADRDGMVAVQAGVIKTKVKENELMLVDGKQVKVSDNPKKPKMASQKSVRAAVVREFRPELDLRGEYTDDAWMKTDKYLDDAAMAGIKSVTLIHGKGTGALRKAIWDKLKKDSRVKSYRAGAYGEGDYGVTVVDLK